MTTKQTPTKHTQRGFGRGCQRTILPSVSSDRAFRVAGPSVWNSLPADHRHPDLFLGQFCIALKRFCLTGSAAPSDCLLLGAAYKCTCLLTYLSAAGPRVKNYLPIVPSSDTDLSYSRFRHFYLISRNKAQCEFPLNAL